VAGVAFGDETQPASSEAAKRELARRLSKEKSLRDGRSARVVIEFTSGSLSLR
jgi:hypothetical protein